MFVKTLSGLRPAVCHNRIIITTWMALKAATSAFRRHESAILPGWLSSIRTERFARPRRSPATNDQATQESSEQATGSWPTRPVERLWQTAEQLRPAIAEQRRWIRRWTSAEADNQSEKMRQQKSINHGNNQQRGMVNNGDPSNEVASTTGSRISTRDNHQLDPRLSSGRPTQRSQPPGRPMHVRSYALDSTSLSQFAPGQSRLSPRFPAFFLSKKLREI